MKRKHTSRSCGAGALAVGLAGPAATTTTTATRAGGAGGGVGEPWILGTTDTVTALDPAGSYDLGSSTLEYNLYQTLLTVPAELHRHRRRRGRGVRLRRPADLHLHAKEGLKFSNGNELTSSDVKYSFERAITIQDAERRRDLPARQHHATPTRTAPSP